ncbi:MAG: hypothetical protein FVQ80_06560 [Planctomycetes bacterium]|nr:hypothetical protein [Planctomycetota bacterium]
MATLTDDGGCVYYSAGDSKLLDLLQAKINRMVKTSIAEHSRGFTCHPNLQSSKEEPHRHGLSWYGPDRHGLPWYGPDRHGLPWYGPEGEELKEKFTEWVSAQAGKHCRTSSAIRWKIIELIKSGSGW